MTVTAPEAPLGRAGIVVLVGLIAVGSVLTSGDVRGLGSYLTYAVVGAFLAARRPRNAIGWILLGIAFGWVANTSYPGIDLAALGRGDASVRDTAIAWLNAWSGRAVFVGFLALTIVFPSGRLSVGRGRVTDLALLAIGGSILLVTLFAPTLTVDPTGSTETIVIANPVGLLPGAPGFWASLLEVGDLAYIALLSVGVGRLLLRYRRSHGVERVQFRWLIAAFASILAAIAFGLAVTAIVGDAIGPAAWIPVSVAYSTIPVAIGIAVMRYRLFEIDRIVSRTIAYTILTGGLIALYLALNLALTGLLSTVTRGDAVAVAASTLVVAALFTPVRRRVQSLVDHRFDRARYDAERTALAFASRLRDQVDLTSVTDDLHATVRAAVAPERVGLWLRDGGTSGP